MLTVHFICPFCGGQARVGPTGAAHMEPTCTTFKELDAEDYVHEVHEVLHATKGTLRVVKPGRRGFLERKLRVTEDVG
jgi:hypothetical protein